MSINADTREAGTGRAIYLPFVVIDFADPSSAGDPTNTLSHASRLDPSRSATAESEDSNIIIYERLRNVLRKPVLLDAVILIDNILLHRGGVSVPSTEVSNSTTVSPISFNIGASVVVGTSTVLGTQIDPPCEQLGQHGHIPLSYGSVHIGQYGTHLDHQFTVTGTSSMAVNTSGMNASYTTAPAAEADLRYHQSTTGWDISIGGGILCHGNVYVGGHQTYIEDAQLAIARIVAKAVHTPLINALANVDTAAGQFYGTATTASNLSTPYVTEPVEYVVARLFSMDPMPEFEDGVNNGFSEGIRSVVNEYGNKGVEILEARLNASDNVSCVGEALRTLGLVDDMKTAERRFRVLILLLKHHSAIVRDGAAVGLAYLDDQRAIPALVEAIETEPLPFLRRDMKAIREQLINR